ncbi:SusD/RagB family nutrient-binding outer membrane lipoprotein [Chitinophagaceae bacterium LWZ2-11]
MKKYIVWLVIILIGVSCTKNLTNLNTDPTQFTTALPEAIMEGVVKKTNDQMANYNTSKYWDLNNTIIQQANRYDLTDAGLWQTMYVNVLENLQQIFAQYGTDSGFVNRVQIARIWQAYTFSILAGNFGPTAMTQANNPNYLSTVLFDNEDSVYTYCLNTLKDAASKINLNKDRLSYDVVYGSDGNSLTRWIKFANTLRLKIALRCQRNLGAVAVNHIRDVMANEANTINSEAETAKMNYENVVSNGANNMNPYYIKYVLPNSYYGTYAPWNSSTSATNAVPKLSDYLLAFFRSYSDPRLGAYFDSVPVMANRAIIRDTLKSTGDDSSRIVTYPVPYFGMPKSPNILPGWTNLNGLVNPMQISNNAFSNATASIFAANRPYVILGYAEAQFLKAEAAQLGLGGSQPASGYYYSGINANFAFWGLPVSAAIAYENVNGIKWGTTGTGFNNYLDICTTNIPANDIYKIWIQSWLNYVPDGAFDSWCLMRRTRALIFAPHTNPGSAALSTPYSDLPDRSVYPTTVQSLNPAGYASALTLLGINGAAADDKNPYIRLHFEAPYTVPDWNAMNANYNFSYVQKWYGTTIQALKSSGVPYTLVSTYK